MEQFEKIAQCGEKISELLSEFDVITALGILEMSKSCLLDVKLEMMKDERDQDGTN